MANLFANIRVKEKGNGKLILQLNAHTYTSKKERDFELDYWAHLFLYDQDGIQDTVSAAILNASHANVDLASIPDSLESQVLDLRDDVIADGKGRTSWKVKVKPVNSYTRIEFPLINILNNSTFPVTANTFNAMIDEENVSDTLSNSAFNFNSQGDGGLDIYGVLVLTNELNGLVVAKTNVLHLKEEDF